MSSSSSDGLLAVSGSLLGLSAITISLRFYARRKNRLPLLMDDWTAVAAFIPYTGAAVCAFIAVHDKVLGYNSNDLHYSQTTAKELAKTSAILQIVINMLTLAALACTKLSALFFYRRLFCVPGPKKWIDIVTAASIVVVTLWFVAFEILTALQCGSHFPALWNGSYERYCVYSLPSLKGLTISDFLLEVWILTVPIRNVRMGQITKLRLSAAKKVSIAGVFALGSIGLGASIARLVQIVQADLIGAPYFVSHNEELVVTSAAYFMILEAGITLVAINLPSLWILVSSTQSVKLDHIRQTVAAQMRRSRSATSSITQSDGVASSAEKVPEKSDCGSCRVFATREVQVTVQDS